MENDSMAVKSVPSYRLALFLKPEALEIIKKAKGWKSDAEIARRLGFNSSYITNLKARRETVSPWFICRVAEILGNTDDNWHIFYELAEDTRVQNKNHQIYNTPKYNNHLLYDKYSPIGNLRRELDKEAEVEA